MGGGRNRMRSFELGSAKRSGVSMRNGNGMNDCGGSVALGGGMDDEDNILH